jgi:hypothetical protein
MRRITFTVLLVLFAAVVGTQQPNPRQQPGAPITLFAPEQHALYDGRFILSANRVYMVGGLNDRSDGTTSTTRRRM